MSLKPSTRARYPPRPPSNVAESISANIDPTHLAITDFGTHSADEVCEHPNPVG
jgi:hypothetical protein